MLSVNMSVPFQQALLLQIYNFFTDKKLDNSKWDTIKE